MTTTIELGAVAALRRRQRRGRRRPRQLWRGAAAAAEWPIVPGLLARQPPQAATQAASSGSDSRSYLSTLKEATASTIGTVAAIITTSLLS